MTMKLFENITETFQSIGTFFDKAFKLLTFSNVVAAVSGSILTVGAFSQGPLTVLCLIVGVLLFFLSGLFYSSTAKKTETRSSLFPELKEGLIKDVSTLKNVLEEATQLLEQIKKIEKQNERPVIIPGQLPTRIKHPQRLPMVEEIHTEKPETPPPLSQPPRTRRKTGA